MAKSRGKRHLVHGYSYIRNHHRVKVPGRYFYTAAPRPKAKSFSDMAPKSFPKGYTSPFRHFLKPVGAVRPRERLRMVALIRVEILKRGPSGARVGSKTVYPFPLGYQTKTEALKWNEEGIRAQWFLTGEGDKKKFLAVLGIYALRDAKERSDVRKRLDKTLRRKPRARGERPKNRPSNLRAKHPPAKKKRRL